MKTRKIGSSGIDASVVALGTFSMGGWEHGGCDESEAIQCIQACLDEGVNFIDTAPFYGFGLSENIVGKAIQGKRDKYIIASKCGLVTHSNGGEYWFNTNLMVGDDNGLISVYRNLTPASMHKELDQSLKRMKTDYIDLYQTHCQDGSTPISDSMSTLLEFKKQGKIRAIGVSNASVDQMKEYQKLGVIDCDQEKYSMLDRGLEKTNLPFIHSHNIALLAWNPLAKGLLTGKVTPDRKFTADDMRNFNPRFSVENRTKIQAFLAKLTPIAQAYKTSLTGLVIAWTLSQPRATHVLCGARNVEQMRDNARGGCIALSEPDVKKITSLLDEASKDLV